MKNKKKISYYKKRRLIRLKREIYEEMTFLSFSIYIIKLFFVLFNLYLISKRKKKNDNNSDDNIHKIKVALCSTVKKENRYLKYFIEHYKNLNYDHIYFADNNELNDESLEDVKEVRDGIKEGFISVANYRGLKFIDAKWFYDCYENHSLEYDWISFFDLDEYLVLEPNDTKIQDYLNNSRFNSCEHIKINWRIFTDNDQLDFEDKHPMERFPIPSGYTKENIHVKSIVRGGLNYTNMSKNYNPHSVYRFLNACSSSGKPIEGRLYYNSPPDLEYAVLYHYVTKSIREFYTKKCRFLGNVSSFSEDFKRYFFSYFFNVNKRTKEKVDIFNQLFLTNYQ